MSKRSSRSAVGLVAIVAFFSGQNLQYLGHPNDCEPVHSSFGFQPVIEVNATSRIKLISDLPPVQQTARRISNRIDFSSCPDHRLAVSTKTRMEVGVGHRLTENFFIFHYALTNGHCFCFDTEFFGNDIELYHLLLEPVLPSCKTAFFNRTLQRTSLSGLGLQSVPMLAKNSHAIQWIEPSLSEVWPSDNQKERPRGYGDVLAFFDNFLRDNRLLDEVVIPWYRKHKSIGSAFRKRDNATTWVAADDAHKNDHDSVHVKDVLNATFHLRVGDIVLESSKSYWRNVFTAMVNIVEIEYGPGRQVDIYWVYFQSNHLMGKDVGMRDRLARNVVGEWPSEPDVLPKSHIFLAKLCEEFVGIECFWKLGTNMLETIDLFVNSDIVYVSGSSFSQVLSLFNRGIRLVALTKELNILGKATKGSIPFLTTSTTALSSLQYYYIDGTGELFDEHYTYLRLNPPNHTVIARES